MHVELVDERDIVWEDPSPRFRVHLYERGPTWSGYATRAYDITEADVLDAINWAQQNVHGDDGLIAVALVWDGRQGEKPERGVAWLLGGDVVHFSPPTHDDQRVLDRMRSRGTTPLHQPRAPDS